MVKMRHRQVPLARVSFSEHRPIGVEVLELSSLLARGLSQPGTPHRTDFHHLLVVTGGRGTHVVDFVRFSLEAGMVVSVAPGQVHQFGRPTRMEARLVVFRPEVLTDAPRLQACVRLPESRLRLVLALMEGLATELRATDGTQRSRALLRALLEGLVRSIEVEQPRVDERVLLSRFEAALEKQFSRTHEVAAFAAILRCSTRTLVRHCLAHTGRSPKRLIEDRVVLEARRRLAYGEETVAQLATALGFAEATQFVKFFRRATHETPGHFRLRARGGEAFSPQR